MKKIKGLSNEEHRQRVEDFCVKQVDLLLGMIQNGESEKWVKPWGANFSGLGQMPHNPQTKHRYSGGNVIFLMLHQHLTLKTPDSRYLTLPQAKAYAEENGLDPNKVRIKKGSTAAMILQPIVIDVNKDKPTKDKEEGSKADAAIKAAESGSADTKRPEDNKDEETKRIVRFKTSPRFNGSQLTGIPDFKLDENQTWSSSAIVDHLLKTNKINIISSPKAAFSPSTDNILMPDIRDFDAPEHHTSTLLHEFYHWTGSQKREKRISENYKEFHDNYAKEEIRAQFFMLAASSMLGIPVKTEQEIDYINHFSGKDGLDYRAVYKEFSQASRMFSDMLVPFVLNEQPAPSWFPQKENWPPRSEQAKAEAIVAEAIVLGQGSTPDVKDNKGYSNEGSAKTDPGLPFATEADTKEERWYHYGVKHPRGVGQCASPPNYADYQRSDKFLGGIVTYDKPLSDRDISHYSYEPIGTTAAGTPFVAVKEEKQPDSSDVFDLLGDAIPSGTDAFDLLDFPQANNPQTVTEEKSISTKQTEEATDPFDLIPDTESSTHSDWNDFGPRR